MKGYPKYFNTKEDILNCLPLFPNKVKTYLQQLLAETENWVLIGKIENEGITDAKHKVVSVFDTETKEIKEKYQYEFKINLNCMLFKFGFTIDEVKKLLQ